MKSVFCITFSLLLLCMSYTSADIINSQFPQEDLLFFFKRAKPSLSIINPLDVLRQRIILEMARRQMRENSKQVEVNKAFLKQMGKRDKTNSLTTDFDPIKWPPYKDWFSAFPVQFEKLQNSKVLPEMQKIYSFGTIYKLLKQSHKTNCSNPDNPINSFYDMKPNNKPI